MTKNINKKSYKNIKNFIQNVYKIIVSFGNDRTIHHKTFNIFSERCN